MGLNYAKAPPSLSRELREVSRDASALLEAMARGLNYSLPEQFPNEQLTNLCRSLIQLPEGTAEGCRAPLEYARYRLPAVRREFILSEELSVRGADKAPLLTRGEMLDQAIATLISSVTTAFDEYRRLVAEEPIEEILPESSVNATEGIVKEAADNAERLDSQIEKIQQDVIEVTRPESQSADNLRRQIRDVRGLNLLAFTELRMPRIVVSWLRLSINALKNYPDLIRRTVKGLRVGTDIVEIAIDRWHEIEKSLSTFVIDQLRKTYDSIEQVAEILDRQRRKGINEGGIQLPTDFDLDEVKKLILRGVAPPPTWRPFIIELNFAGEQLRDLSPLLRLNKLASLNLAGTQVNDLSALSTLNDLLILNLAGTPISDISPLSELKNLRDLNVAGTQVQDISTLSKLENLQNLILATRRIADIGALSYLGSLKTLVLSSLRIRDASALANLRNLVTLKIANTKIHDLTPISNLENLEHLDLPGTPVDDVSPLSKLQALRSLNLAGTRVRNIEPLGSLNKLVFLDLRHAPIRSVGVLAALRELKYVDLTGVHAADKSSFYLARPDIKGL